MVSSHNSLRSDYTKVHNLKAKRNNTKYTDSILLTKRFEVGCKSAGAGQQTLIQEEKG